VPDFNNPTGALIATDQRSAVLQAARRSGTRVVVDESFIDLDLRTEAEQAAAGTPNPMAALDSHVLSLGSVSKPIWGGVRVGWVRADEDLINQLAVVRARSDMSGSVLDQLLTLHALGEGGALLARRRDQLRLQRDALLAALAEQLPQWQPGNPAGGLSTWVRLDAAACTELTHAAQRHGVLITPGSRFANSSSLERYLRLPYTLPAEVLVEAVGRLARAWQQRAPGSRPAASIPT
jgi:DNA-binding transcriptional MocR family regulator